MKLHLVPNLYLYKTYQCGWETLKTWYKRPRYREFTLNFAFRQSKGTVNM